MASSSRRTAAFALARWILTKEFVPSLLPDGPDRSFVQDLVFTAIRRLRPLRLVLGELVRKWPKGELEALLYIGAAQILYMKDVPDFAAVSETVEAAKSANGSSSAVVNGVLRNLIRRREEFERMIDASPLEVRESFPTRLVKRWIARFGEEKAGELCRLHNEPANTYIARRDGTYVVLERGVKVDSVEGYASGGFIVQDPAARHAVELLSVKEGEKILDACAAPGGKAVQIAWRGADLTACEVNPRRRRTLEENLARLSLGSVEVVGSIPEKGTRLFDKILVDVPCSNTGVFRRRPDARWNWSEEKLSSLISLQSQILESVSPLLAPGGTLVYSTCSNEPEENSAQVTAFLSRHGGFSLVGERESLPFETGEDGAYAAALVKADGSKGS